MLTTLEEKGKTVHDANQILTTEKITRLTDEMLAAFKRGDAEEGVRIGKIIPLHPIMAMAVKNIYGKDFLMEMDLNLTRANKKWGEGWINEPYKG